ncbi:MAG: glycerophosphodiester phosphodiesterase [Gammaproteobacteria bacterium]|nr:glycerophosphodiester phosphodiesterase [Gammaproteobacteria bacterium]
MNEFFDITKPIIIAHRGANALAPENTLEAFNLAYQMGADWIECDVVLTADGIPVILHDRSLWRTARKRVYIDKLNYAALKEYNVGRYFSKNHALTPVPSLKDVLDLALQYQRGINIEIKPALPEYAHETAERSWQVIAPYINRIPILVSSFEIEVLYWYQQHAPQVKLGYLLSHWQLDWQEKAKRLNAISIHCQEKLLTPKHLSALKLAGYIVLAYTVNDVAHAQALWAMGVDGFFSDDPKLLD